ncbi:MAG: Do family serine endopeptidase [Spirochaetia bacterium]
MRKKQFVYGVAAIAIAALVGSLTAGLIVFNLLDTKTYRVAYAQGISAADEQLGKRINDLFLNVANSVLPSVVHIDVVSVQKRPAPQNFWEFFFNEQPRGGGSESPQREYRQAALGSGFVVDRQGKKLYILTNSHVVGEATTINVEFQDGRRFSAKLLGKDPRKDLALIEAMVEDSDSDLRPVPLGDSDKIQVGEWVLAMGSPFGFGFSVTSGIVSFLKRVGGPQGNVSDFIQTDAAINQGNSGGPLVNLRGEVVGVNTWIASQSGGSIGLGFAVPINNIKQSIEDLKSGKTPEYGWLGISVTDPRALSTMSSPEYIDSAGWPKQVKGAMVMQIFKGSPAEKQGLLPGDLILRVNGQEIDNSSHFVSVVGTLTANSDAKLNLLRNGKAMELNIKLDVRKEDSVLNTEAKDGWPSMTVLPLTQDLRTRLKLVAKDQGVVVADIIPKSLLATAGLRGGDLITSVNDQKTTSIQTFYAALNTAAATGRLKIEFMREGQKLNITVNRR